MQVSDAKKRILGVKHPQKLRNWRPRLMNQREEFLKQNLLIQLTSWSISKKLRTLKFLRQEIQSPLKNGKEKLHSSQVVLNHLV